LREDLSAFNLFDLSLKVFSVLKKTIQYCSLGSYAFEVELSSHRTTPLFVKPSVSEDPDYLVETFYMFTDRRLQQGRLPNRGSGLKSTDLIDANELTPAEL